MHLRQRHSIVDLSESSIGVGEEVSECDRVMLELELVDAEEGILDRVVVLISVRGCFTATSGNLCLH